MDEHQRHYYGGRAWANEIAKRGYVVLVHDTFTFASRRVLFQDMAEIPWGPTKTKGMSDDDPESSENIKTYNDWAAGARTCDGQVAILRRYDLARRFFWRKTKLR